MNSQLHHSSSFRARILLIILSLVLSQCVLAQRLSSISPKLKFGIGQQAMLFYVEGSIHQTFPDIISYDTVIFCLWNHKTELSLQIYNDFGRFGFAFQDRWLFFGDFDAFTFDLGVNLLSTSRKLRHEYFLGPGIAKTNLMPYDYGGFTPCLFIGGKNFEARFECSIRNEKPFHSNSLTSSFTLKKTQLYSFTMRYYFPINLKRKHNKTTNP
jgi:hypothetical protein